MYFYRTYAGIPGKLVSLFRSASLAVYSICIVLLCDHDHVDLWLLTVKFD